MFRYLLLRFIDLFRGNDARYECARCGINERQASILGCKLGPCPMVPKP